MSRARRCSRSRAGVPPPCYHSHVLRRVHTQVLRTGELTLDPAAARHLRNVLRLSVDDVIEVFDDDGAVARAHVLAIEPEVIVHVHDITPPDAGAPELTVASAVAKGERADWMVEKLSELGVARFVPLSAARSVVLPEGKNKRERWARIATESAKQSRRRGVMRIEPLTSVDDLLRAARSGPGGSAASGAGRDAGVGAGDAGDAAYYLSTAADAVPIARALLATPSPAPARVTLLIGPEGGWTDAEIDGFARAGFAGLKLTETVLRVETAAIAAAAVVATLLASNRPAAP